MSTINPSDVIIEVPTKATQELVDSWGRLLPQLSHSAKSLTMDDLEDLITSSASRLYIARVGGNIAGSLTLVMYRIPVGRKAWIEDVVVDEKYRGKGIGEQLVRVATQWALENGARNVNLTSSPLRESANRLYGRAGFQQRETNVYRYVSEERRG